MIAYIWYGYLDISWSGEISGCHRHGTWQINYEQGAHISSLLFRHQFIYCCGVAQMCTTLWVGAHVTWREHGVWTIGNQYTAEYQPGKANRTDRMEIMINIVPYKIRPMPFSPFMQHTHLVDFSLGKYIVRVHFNPFLLWFSVRSQRTMHFITMEWIQICVRKINQWWNSNGHFLLCHNGTMHISKSAYYVRAIPSLSYRSIATVYIYNFILKNLATSAYVLFTLLCIRHPSILCTAHTKCIFVKLQFPIHRVQYSQRHHRHSIASKLKLFAWHIVRVWCKRDVNSELIPHRSRSIAASKPFRKRVLEHLWTVAACGWVMPPAYGPYIFEACHSNITN